jgi:hypothetical protein
VRASSDRLGSEIRAAVPLTGREPVLGRLRNRLRHRGPGWGWVTLSGPSGSGVSRLIQEVASLLAEDGAPPPLKVGPVPADAPPLEGLRRAFAGALGGASVEACARALRAVLPTGRADPEALARWVAGGPTIEEASRPSAAVARVLLEALAGVGPVLVDDLDRVDEATRSVLATTVDRRGPGVIAGHSGPIERAPAGTVWPLDPLTEAQVELLLRRWLRDPVAARRLAPELRKRCEGWPGRVVALVRALARLGHLKRDDAGVLTVRWPRQWPDLVPPETDLVTWARARGAATCRVLELAAVYGGPADPAVLAESAGVKRAFVEGVFAAAAERPGAVAGPTGLDAAAAHDILGRLTPGRRVLAAQRLAKALGRRAVAGTLDASAAAAHVRVLLLAGPADALAGALDRLLDRMRDARPGPLALDLLAEAGARLAEAEDPRAGARLAAAARLLLDAGHVPEATRLLDAPALRNPAPAVALAAAACRARLAAGTPAAARAARRLREALAGSDGTPAEDRFDAGAVLADVVEELDPRGARESWRAALRAMPDGDVVRRARAHRGLASVAGLLGRARARAAHLDRGASLLMAAGEAREAARLWLDLGAEQAASGRMARGLASLERAVRVFGFLGRRADEALARLVMGSACMEAAAYDEAVEHLEAALVVAREAREERLLARIRVALSRAHAAHGRLDRARSEAEAVAHGDGPDDILLEARALLAEFDARTGKPAALDALIACEAELRAQGLRGQARRARDVMADALLRDGDAPGASGWIDPRDDDPVARLFRARLALLRGRPRDACATLEAIAHDASAPVSVRAEAAARLAEVHQRRDRTEEARTTAVAASALLEVSRRSHAEDPRIHRLLAHVFSSAGERGRSAGHRQASRRCLRLPEAGASGPERRRLFRALCLGDPWRAPALAS